MRLIITSFILLNIFMLTACGGASNSNKDSKIPVNSTPVAKPDQVSTNQNQRISIEVLNNDTDANNDSLSIKAVTLPSNGQANIKGSSVEYTPKDGFVGNDYFNYTISDDKGGTAISTVTINVINVAPQAINDEVSTNQNQIVIITPLNNDIDVTGDLLSVAFVSEARHGTITLENNNISYTPENGYVGIDSFSYTIIDISGASSEATVTINVNNIDPQVIDDEVEVFKNSSVTIDVLNNDSDVLGDELTIQSLSSPQHGSAEIVENKIYYQPTTGFSGNDVFSYTVIDKYDAVTSGFVYVKVNNGILINGKLVNFTNENQKISIKINDQEYTGYTDQFGHFSIRIDASEPDAIVTATAENVTSNYSLKAYLGNVATLLENMDENFTVIKNITDVTTAEYELLNYINNNTAITTLEKLIANQLLVDGDLLLKLVVSAELIYQDNNIELPSEFTSVNQFFQNPFAVNKQLAVWRANNPESYYSNFNALIDNEDLTSNPDKLIQGDHILLQARADGKLNYANTLNLDVNGIGYYSRSFPKLASFTWNREQSFININFDQAFSIVNFQEEYCGDKGKKYINFSANSMQLKHFHAALDYDLYIAKIEGGFNNSDCVNSNEHNFYYLTYKIMKNKSFNITSGDYVLETFIESVNVNNPVKYDSIVGEFKFLDDGTFTEINDMPKARDAKRTGIWKNENNQLILTYSNGLTVYYNKTSNYRGLKVLNSYVKFDDKIIIANQSFLVSKQTVNFEISEGYLTWTQLPFFDPALTYSFRFEFNNDGTGIQQNYQFGEYKNSSSSIFSWQQVQNNLTLDYYLLKDTYDFVNFCDINDSNCMKWRQRDMEILKPLDNDYVIKVYQEYFENVEIGIQPYRGGYIAIFNKTL